MAQTIEVKGYGELEFPDDMSDEQIAAAIKSGIDSGDLTPVSTKTESHRGKYISDEERAKREDAANPQVGMGEAAVRGVVAGTPLPQWEKMKAAMVQYGGGSYMDPLVQQYDDAKPENVKARADLADKIEREGKVREDAAKDQHPIAYRGGQAAGVVGTTLAGGAALQAAGKGLAAAGALPEVIGVGAESVNPVIQAGKAIPGLLVRGGKFVKPAVDAVVKVTKPVAGAVVKAAKSPAGKFVGKWGGIGALTAGAAPTASKLWKDEIEWDEAPEELLKTGGIYDNFVRRGNRTENKVKYGVPSNVDKHTPPDLKNKPKWAVINVLNQTSPSFREEGDEEEEREE